jgi:hypothetical protein
LGVRRISANTETAESKFCVRIQELICVDGSLHPGWLFRSSSEVFSDGSVISISPGQKCNEGLKLRAGFARTSAGMSGGNAKLAGKARTVSNPNQANSN